MTTPDSFDPEDSSFLPVAVRRIMYVLGLAATILAPILGVQFPEYREGFQNAGMILQAAALGTAIANVKTDGRG